MNDDQSKDHELTEGLLEISSSKDSSKNFEKKHQRKGKNSKYKNVPKRSASLKRADSTRNCEEYPDRTIITNEPDIALPDNSIKTTKYNWATFIPKNLLEQFSKLPNLYFLLIGVLQMLPPITQTAGQPLIYIPLTLVITISAIKDLFEDLERRKDDTRENHSQTLKLTDKSFVQCQWKDLKVGDIIKVEEGEYIPADIVILKTSEKKGNCAIETKNLDGETNLKSKTTDKKLMDFFKSEDDLWEKHIEIDYEKQNPNLYSFTGTAKLDGETKVPLDMKNMALRACSLKTPWVIGVVAYSGHHTKIMLNSVGARPKSSRLEKLMNKEVLTIFIIQNIWCLLSAIYATIWYKSSQDFFLELVDEDQKLSPTFGYFIERYGAWLLLFTNLVPISLLVTLEMVKFIQAKVMEKDRKMVDSVIESHTSVHTSSLMEELGQVQYVFSDKTGTLTRNVMEFQKFCVQDKSYGDNKDEEDMESKPQVSNVNFADKQFFEEFKNQDKSSSEGLHEMIFLLAVCHSASIEKSEDDEAKYTASSPDDIALVNFAKLCGYEYLDTDENNNIILKIDGKEAKIKLLKQLEFTSERKMMSAIIENEDGKVILYCKGADSALLQKSKQDKNENVEAIKKNLHKYASEGLRTLLVGKREISKEEFESWDKKYEEALCQLENREEAVSKCQEELEKDLTIIGATGIEDKLQDEVDETIDLLKKAGIKVWVLTGDKTETAINIGYSSKLLDDEQEIFIIDVQNQEELDKKIEEIKKRISHDKLGKDKAYAVVITGYAIVDAFNPDVHNKAAGKKLFEIFSDAKVVLGCRISPKQKKDIVELVKKNVPSAVTLAIGDGANDVNMITAAHVGVGIKGLEGYQAARASDFAIGEFKLLRRLLFFYGRETYRKNSYLVLYNFFKNIILILPHFWYGFYNGMSGTILYEPFIFQFFNVFYAALPIIIFAVFDQEYDSKFLETNPEYYTPGIKDNYFNFPIFWGWFGSATLQSVFIGLIAFQSLEVGAINKEGLMLGYWNSGMMAYTSVILCANLKILLFSNTYNLLVALGLAISVVTYVYSFKISSFIESSPDYSEYDLLTENWYFYLGLILMVCCTTLMDFALSKYLHKEELVKDNQGKKQLKKAHTQELEL